MNLLGLLIDFKLYKYFSVFLAALFTILMGFFTIISLFGSVESLDLNNFKKTNAKVLREKKVESELCDESSNSYIATNQKADGVLIVDFIDNSNNQIITDVCNYDSLEDKESVVIYYNPENPSEAYMQLVYTRNNMIKYVFWGYTLFIFLLFLASLITTRGFYGKIKNDHKEQHKSI